MALHARVVGPVTWPPDRERAERARFEVDDGGADRAALLHVARPIEAPAAGQGLLQDDAALGVDAVILRQQLVLAGADDRRLDRHRDGGWAPERPAIADLRPGHDGSLGQLAADADEAPIPKFGQDDRLAGLLLEPAHHPKARVAQVGVSKLLGGQGEELPGQAIRARRLQLRDPARAHQITDDAVHLGDLHVHPAREVGDAKALRVLREHARDLEPEWRQRSATARASGQVRVPDRGHGLDSNREVKTFDFGRRLTGACRESYCRSVRTEGGHADHVQRAGHHPSGDP